LREVSDDVVLLMSIFPWQRGHSPVRIVLIAKKAFGTALQWGQTNPFFLHTVFLALAMPIIKHRIDAKKNSMSTMSMAACFIEECS
jgi:hypothetical protein